MADGSTRSVFSITVSTAQSFHARVRIVCRSGSLRLASQKPIDGKAS